MVALFWFRRDNRLNDNVALNRAIEHAVTAGNGNVFAVSLIEQDAFEALGGLRQHSLVASLEALSDSMAGQLNIVQGANRNDTVARLCSVAKQLGVSKVFATRAFDPEGVAVQNTVGLALKEIGVFLELHGSNYAVEPGSVRKPDGSPYRVYTPFYKAWMQIGWVAPVTLSNLPFKWQADASMTQLPVATKPAPFKVIAGEVYALRTLERFRQRSLATYNEDRNRADLSGTSHLSHALSFGEIHPRTILATLGDQPGPEVFRKEIAWREFYGDVLWHAPHSYDQYLDPKYANMRYDTGVLAETRLAAWQQGRTGYPMVDAGMRQLLETGWMHNRVRMIVASFLVKDLHLEWQQGAQWFEQHLTDFDPASNSHGWQWTAGCGTDASPYYRVFNPVLQGLKFDPNGNYVRKYVPELRHIDGSAVHEPWNLIDGGLHGYPQPIVDHSAERDESLRRLEELKTR